jgi:hypothetical protein
MWTMFRAVISDRTGTRVTTVPTWAVGLGAFGAALIGLTLFVIGAGLALILAPLAIGAILVARWRLKAMLRNLQENMQTQSVRAGVPPRPSDPSIIEGEYRVIDPDRR